MTQGTSLVPQASAGLQFSTQDLFSAFGSEVMTRAMSIALRDGVRRHDVASNGTRVAGQVLGDQGRAYHQTIALSRAGTEDNFNYSIPAKDAADAVSAASVMAAAPTGRRHLR